MRLVAFLTILLLFSGCIPKQYESNEVRLIVLKTPKWKFADMGFIRKSGDSVELEIFSAGKAILNIRVNDSVCVDWRCMSARAFNAKYLHPSYPSTLFANVLRGRAIFSGKERIFIDGEYDIEYKVASDRVLFRDRLNKIFIKIDRVKY